MASLSLKHDLWTTWVRIVRCLLKMHISESSRDLFSHMVGPGICMLNKLPREFWCMLKFENLYHRWRDLLCPSLIWLYYFIFYSVSHLFNVTLWKHKKKIFILKIIHIQDWQGVMDDIYLVQQFLWLILFYFTYF